VNDLGQYPQVDEWQAIAKLLESAGYTGIWAAEHHFTYDPGATPTPTNPLLLGAFVASQTTTLRIGQCGVSMPAWHPLRVAEDAAMLDHMTHGRLDFGFMKGLHGKVSRNFDSLVDRTRDHEKTNPDVMWESVEIIRKWWTGEPFRHDGKYFTFPYPWRTGLPAEYRDPRFYNEEGEMIAIQGIPTPYQKPYPPCWVMSDSVASTIRAAQAGVGTICWANTFEGAREVFAAHRKASAEAAEAGTLPQGANRHVAMMRPTFVAKNHETLEQVMRPAVNGLMKFATFGLEHWIGRKAMLASWEEMTDQDLNDDWYDFSRRHGQIIVGTPEQVTETLKRYEQEALAEHFVQFWALPGISFEQMAGSVKLFADEVMPHFNDSVPEPAAPTHTAAADVAAGV
jgi:alkanesulfonate monooxygenase SsuD/methylene tetrahydromethanopterin reductase-like flavin-dependent oxidoreductase (luciferase family)